MDKKYVYLFKEGNSGMKELLGGKGANLAEMTSLGMPIPQGFTITTEACNKYYDDNEQISEEIVEQINSALIYLEDYTGKKLGSKDKPLLVSVRSGARASMPGMMDTILNLGMNDEVVLAFAAKNRRFAYDSYRRFIQMYSDVVREVPKKLFEDAIDLKKQQRGLTLDTDMDANDLEDLVRVFKGIYRDYLHEEFPQDTRWQLYEAVKAVFRSWNNPRAITYRKLNDIPSSWGTAVNVQSMVFGNMGDDCGTGVAFSRNPATGTKEIFGEYLMNAQGEDVVAGIRTPQEMDTLKYVNPDAYNEFAKYADILEKHYKDMQDMEFTIEHGKLYMLQTRNAKRTAVAALKVAVDMVSEGLIDEREAMLRVDPEQLNQLLHPDFDKNKLKNAKVITKGLPASPGAATGKIVFTAERAQELAEQGEKELILVRLETSPEDIEGMVVCSGILTVRGGMTSHAAVVARGMGTCCVAGCGELSVNSDEKVLYTKDGMQFHEGDYISIDGSTGIVYGQKVDTVDASVSGDFATFMGWADSIRTLEVRTNADNPRDAKKAYEFGAQGIGLCRTEHMFFENDRIAAIREMIVADTVEQREAALNKILPMQRGDFEELFRTMKGYPVTIRLLDPPLHEFLPKKDNEIADLANDMGMSYDKLKSIVLDLHEFNPMMGFRGCRLDVKYPEIAVMQTKAIIEAAINVKNEGTKVIPEIMIPLVGDATELAFVKNIVETTADEMIKNSGSDIQYHIGTMIEIPRACLIADKIAENAEFFSFGTNDLTQLTYGFSRDDAGKFLKYYYEKKIFESDPFQKVDQEGVGKLMKIAIEDSKKVRPNIELGICGEHGGNPPTVEFCHNIGLTYVSCSPFRVPIARLAAAQAVVKAENNKMLKFKAV